MQAKNVLIIEDEILIAKDISFLLEDLGFNCVGIAKNSQKAQFLFSTYHIDLILCDININGEKDGIETIELLSKTKKVPVIYLSAHSDDEIINRAMSTMPYSYLVKPYNERNLHVAINLALHHHEKENKPSDPNDFLNQFTKREKNIIQLLAAGKNSLEIADILVISEKTVSKHRSNILKKGNCKSSTELLHKYYQSING
jgi:DNA-binding NarL/FixJ family response regulator